MNKELLGQEIVKYIRENPDIPADTLIYSLHQKYISTFGQNQIMELVELARPGSIDKSDLERIILFKKYMPKISSSKTRDKSKPKPCRWRCTHLIDRSDGPPAECGAAGIKLEKM